MYVTRDEHFSKLSIYFGIFSVARYPLASFMAHCKKSLGSISKTMGGFRVGPGGHSHPLLDFFYRIFVTNEVSSSGIVPVLWVRRDVSLTNFSAPSF